MLALLNDPHLRKVFSPGELKAALDDAGKLVNDGEEQ